MARTRGRTGRSLFVCIAVALAGPLAMVAGCGGDSSAPSSDAGADASSDGSTSDAAPDGTGDAAGDTGADAPFTADVFAPDGAPLDGTPDQQVLVWNTNPTAANAAPDLVLGGTGPASATTTLQPVGVATDGTHLFVADEAGNRVLSWNTIPTATPAPADFAFGQPAGATTLTSYGTPNTGVESGATMKTPSHATSDGTRVFVADSGNNRVLVWNAIPSSPVPADLALGQPAGATNLTTAAAGTAADGMNGPESVYSDGTRLFVADSNNNRVLVWNPIPTTNGAAASSVGQLGGS